MTVWIVIQNGHLDSVFDNEESAIHHAKQLTRKWSITEVIKKEVLSV